MIRKLVLFTKGIETLSFFSEQLGEAFEKLGSEVFYFDQCAEYDSLARLVWFSEPGVTAAVSFNFDGCRGESYLTDAKGVNFFEARGIPLINIVVDHPFYYHKFLPYLPEDYTQIYIDREHGAYLERFFPEIKRGPFLPLAGTSLWGTDGPPGWDERPIDVVFTGNYTPLSHFEPALTRINDEYTEFYYGIIQDFIEHPHLGMGTGIIRHLEREVEDISEAGIKEIMPDMIMIDLYVRNYFRGEVVKSLAEAGIPVTCYGAGWEHLECARPDMLIRGEPLSSLDCLRQISRAKISLNVLPWFKEGAHDRVFNSMLNGAVCITDWSRYLEEELEAGEDLLFYELNEREALAEETRALLGDRERWEEISRRGFRTASERHTWAARARRIHEEILCKTL